MNTLAKWTVEEYHQMIEAGILKNHRVELLVGEIIEMPPKGSLMYFMVKNWRIICDRV